MKEEQQQKKIIRKPSQNCKSSMQMQSCIATVKSVTEYTHTHIYIYTHKQNQNSPTKIKYNRLTW